MQPRRKEPVKVMGAILYHARKNRNSNPCTSPLFSVIRKPGRSLATRLPS